MRKHVCAFPLPYETPYVVVMLIWIAHCLDILRQQLMCTVDFGIFGQIWVYPDHPEPFVDFNSVHVCRNFEAVREWAERNQLPEKVSGEFLIRPAKESVYDEIP